MPTTEAPTRTEAEDATKPKRQTWKDWVPAEGLDIALADAEPLLTRDELIAALHEHGVTDVTTRDLSFWHRRGVLPYPTRRKDGPAVMAVYPQWFIRLVRALRRHQREGLPLRRIGPVLRVLVEQTFVPRPVSAERQRAIEQATQGRAYFDTMNDIAPRVRTLAGIVEVSGGRPIIRAEIRLYVDDGSGRSIPIPLDHQATASPDSDDVIPFDAKPVV